MAASATAHNFMYFMLQMVAKTHTNTHQQQQQQQPSLVAPPSPPPTTRTLSAQHTPLLLSPPLQSLLSGSRFSRTSQKTHKFHKVAIQSINSDSQPPDGSPIAHPVCRGGVGGMDRGHFTVMLTYTITQLKRTQEKQRKSKKEAANESMHKFS